MSNNSKPNAYLLAVIPVCLVAAFGLLGWWYQSKFDAGELQSDIDYKIEMTEFGRTQVLMNLQLTNNTDETITTTEVRFHLRSRGQMIRDAAKTATMTVSEELSVILPDVQPGDSSTARQEFRHVMKAGDDDWSRWTIHPPRGTRWKGVMTVQPILVHNNGELRLDPVEIPIEPWKRPETPILNLPDDPEATIKAITSGNGVVEM